MAFDRQMVFDDVVRILSDLREDWEHSDPITDKTGFFGDLGFESIDAVALGSSLEDHYNRTLPFAEFLNTAGKRQAKDIYVGDLVDMLMENLNGQAV